MSVGCLVVLVISVLMVVVGDPFWNIYFIWFGFFVALPVGLVAVGLMILSRRRSAAGMQTDRATRPGR
jgi:hypothetical protein